MGLSSSVNSRSTRSFPYEHHSACSNPIVWPQRCIPHQLPSPMFLIKLHGFPPPPALQETSHCPPNIRCFCASHLLPIILVIKLHRFAPPQPTRNPAAVLWSLTTSLLPLVASYELIMIKELKTHFNKSSRTNLKPVL